MPIRKLLLAALAYVLLCALLASCTSPASGPSGQLGGLTRVSLNEPAAGKYPAAFLVRVCLAPTIYASLTPFMFQGRIYKGEIVPYSAPPGGVK